MGNIEPKIDLLKNYFEKNTIICLNEVQNNIFQNILEKLSPEFYSYSLDKRIPGKNEGRNRKLGVCIIGNSFKIIENGIADRTLFPERTNYAFLENINKKIKIFSFHSITGCDYKKAKSSNFASIADFIELNNFDFITFDANEPKVDVLDENKLEFYDNKDKGKNAGLILGANRVHTLNDSLRAWHLQNNIFNENDPLSISFKTKTESKRYDYIYYEPSLWKIINIKYDYDNAVKAESDHAIIISEYEEK